MPTVDDTDEMPYGESPGIDLTTKGGKEAFRLTEDDAVTGWIPPVVTSPEFLALENRADVLITGLRDPEPITAAMRQEALATARLTLGEGATLDDLLDAADRALAWLAPPPPRPARSQAPEGQDAP